MRILDKKEVQKLEFLGRIRKSNRTVSEFVQNLKKMEVGEALIVKKSEWKLKSLPSTRANAAWRDGSLDKRHSFISKKIDTGDYCILRIK